MICSINIGWSCRRHELVGFGNRVEWLSGGELGPGPGTATAFGSLSAFGSRYEATGSTVWRTSSPEICACGFQSRGVAKWLVETDTPFSQVTFFCRPEALYKKHVNAYMACRDFLLQVLLFPPAALLLANVSRLFRGLAHRNQDFS